MPTFDQGADQLRKGKVIKSAFDSETFDVDGTIHVEGLVGSATIAPSGRDVALASPDGLAIIDLDLPYNPPRRLRSHGMPWLVVDVQWSPFAVRDNWIVSTANHRALVWNLNLSNDSNSGAIEHSLQGHSRAITDVNWSAHHPDILATCSVDGYVHSWDLRKPRQPVLTFCDWFAGAAQVKFNRQDQHIIASAHDQFLHIWDERRSSEPLRTFKAHKSKIYGLDWNRTVSSAIVTCSVDKTIKFWDYSKDTDQPDNVIHTDFPVWRARHTPFGWGLLAMPQNEPGDLHLFDTRFPEGSPTDVRASPVAVFPGHGDHKAKEFLWRSRGGISEDTTDNREFQLVSWGGDNDLRLQCIDPSYMSAVGFTQGGPARKGLTLTRKGATYKTFRAVDENMNRDRKTATMSDPRPGSSNNNNFRQSALTLGMRSSGTQSNRVGSNWRGPSMKAKSTPGRTLDRQSQIGWMKGIVMTKRKVSTDASKRHGSKSSDIFGHGYPDDEWGEPDTIHEEVLRVSHQLPKVKWEDIDMENSILNASLNGPWGVDGETTFIKVRIEIPLAYPKTKAPKFYIEKTSFMPAETHQKMENEIHQLADQFLLRKQNCLEVAFTYLLGEVDLESSTTFFKNVRDLDDDLDGLADESSSEDDEDIPTGGSASMSQELPPHSELETTLAPPNRTIIPPTPRTCGARFSPNGRLVCFIPTKEEKARALFSTTMDAYKERPKGEPFFAGFGRITHESGPRQRFLSDDISGSEDDSDSDESGSSSSTSSDSESTSIHKINLWYHPRRQFRKTWSENRSIRSSGGGTGAGTGTGTGTSRRRPGRPRNIISIHDLRAELPSKQEFAGEYAIFGDGGDVCEHNAQVAEKHGARDLMDVWRYLGLLLNKGIPLELLQHNQRRDSILVIAHDIVSKVRADTSTPELSEIENDSNLSGRVKWGTHPLAKDFIMDLFTYFEQIADIQMLAMLSCIFSESSAEDSVAYVESQLPQPETPLPLKAPSFSLDYFPTDASLWNVYSRSYSNSAATTPMTLHTPVHYAGSIASEEGVWNGDPASNSYSCGETPPTKFKGYLGELEAPPSMSTSPNTRFNYRATPGLASAFSATLPKSFAVGTASSSPPTHGKKKPSPAETILSSLAPSMSNITWSASTAIDTGGRASFSDDEYRRDEMLPLVPVNVAVVMEDQTIFDDDGWLSTPLLDSSKNEVYSNYRYAYAEMLQMWNQPLARLEIMKFNILKEHMSLGHHDGSFRDSMTIHDGSSGTGLHKQASSSPIVLGKKDQLQVLLASGRGLDVTGVCRIHETQLEPLRYTSTGSAVGGAVGTCDRCHRTQSQLKCVYCLEPISALFPPCLACGCASHEACLAEWHAAGETSCPAGDECECCEEADDGQVESWAALQGAMLKGRGHLPMLPSAALDSIDEDERTSRDWERIDSNVPSRPPGLPTGLSFGSRLKRSAGEWSRASSLRRRDDRKNA